MRDNLSLPVFGKLRQIMAITLVIREFLAALVHAPWLRGKRLPHNQDRSKASSISAKLSQFAAKCY